MVEAEGGPNYYTQTDHLASIGFQAQPGDIYYINPPKELSSYPMYIDNPKKTEKTVGSYIAYTLDGTDITERLSRRYSDFFALYEKLLQRWPGVYIPRIPPKKITGNLDPAVIKTRMRLLNRFCLNLSNIDYLYKAEETNIFRNNIPDVANAINKLPELSLSETLSRLKEAFPEANENYDIIVGKPKIAIFEDFLKKSQKNLDAFMKSVVIASEKSEVDKKQYLELVKNLTNYEKDNLFSYADNNENALIFFNPSNAELSEKMIKLKQELVNPFVAFRDWLQEETLDVEAMLIAIKGLYNLLEQENKLKTKLAELEEQVKKGQQGQVNIFKSLFKKKEDIIAETEKEKNLTQQKINDIEEIIRIVGDNMENQMEIFKTDKTKNYYKYLKTFAIMQRESNRVIRELWTLVHKVLDNISPNAGEDEYPQENEITNEPNENEDNQAQKDEQEQNEIHDENPEEQNNENEIHEEQPQEQNNENEIHEEQPQEQNNENEAQENENVENQENNEEPPAQEGEEGGEGGEKEEGGEGGEGGEPTE